MLSSGLDCEGKRNQGSSHSSLVMAVRAGLQTTKIRPSCAKCCAEAAEQGLSHRDCESARRGRV